MRSNDESENSTILDQQRFEIVQQLEDWLEWPMIILGFVWLILLIIEFVKGANPVLSIVNTTIWAAFVVDFGIKFFLAPHKRNFLASNWLTVISLLVPALRVARLSRVLLLARAGRGVRLVRIVASLNRGMRALRSTMSRRGFGYIVLLSAVVIFSSAAGMYEFEKNFTGSFESYADALWWSAMIVVTMGSGYWPQSGEGKLLCLGMSLYGFGILGYVTASLASFFVGRDADSEEGEIASSKTLRSLCDEISSLRSELRQLK
jgi:voltage-gated potassium channel